MSKGQICRAIRDGQLDTVGQVKSATKAGTGCGGCLPLVTQLLHAELKAAGRKVNNHLCEHFAYTRQELFQIVKIKQIRTFDELVESHGRGNGCEICKPAVASILASLWNENILDHVALQDTNDRFLANIQRGGSYSVIPRVPGGEITPEKLITIGRIAKKYGLYTKLTGGQRVDMLGAPGTPIARYMGRIGRCRVRERTRLRQGPEDREELRGHDLVPFRGGRFDRVRRPPRASLSRHPRPAQNQGGRFRMRP